MKSQIYSQIQNDIKLAMKAKDSTKLTTLRSIVDSVQKKLLTKIDIELTDELVNDCINKNIKQREESITAYTKANRNDLVQIEKRELEIIKEYQPKQLSEEEIRNHVKELLKQLKILESPIVAISIGSIMNAVMKQLKGKADGSLISKIVKEELSK